MYNYSSESNKKGGKTMNRRKMVVLWLLILMVVFNSSFIVCDTYAATNYNSSAALNYASGHWNDGVGLCAEFVSNCLKAGGCTAYSASASALFSQLRNSGMGQVYEIALSSDKSIYMPNYSGKIEAGDPVFYYCPGCKDGRPYIHTVLCNGADANGYMKAYSHNNANNGSSKYKYITRCYKCNTTISKAYVYHFKKQTQMTGYSMSIDNPIVRPSSIMYVTVTPYQGTPTNIKVYFEKTDGSSVIYFDCGAVIDRPLVGLPVGQWYMYAEITDEYGSFKGAKDNGSVLVTSRDAEWGANVDIGSDFTAYIKHTSAGTVVTNDSPNVSSRSLTYGDNQIWRFVKLSDGSYKIINQKDSKCLTVTTNGSYYDTINVKVDNYSCLDTQKWYVYNDGYGGYYLRPKCSINVVLDLDAALKNEGTNYQIWSYSGGITQRFNIVKYSKHTTCVWDSGKVTKAATCTTSGTYTYTCTVCGKTKTSSIAATGHRGGEANCTSKAKCIVCNTSYGNYGSHDYSTEWTIDKNATCTVSGAKSHHCKICGDKKDITLVPATGHIGGSATCSQYSRCNACGVSYGSLGTHKYNTQWTIDKPATCTTTGTKSYHCVYCDSKKDITVIPVTGHSGGVATCKEQAKCTSCGMKYGNYAQHQYVAGECTVCGNVIESQKNDNTNNDDYYYSDFDSESDTSEGDNATKEDSESNKQNSNEANNTQIGNDDIVLKDSPSDYDNMVNEEVDIDISDMEEEDNDEGETYDMEVGDVYENEITGDIYEITCKASSKNTVEYLGREKSTGTVVIPDYITIDGVKYYVTSIAEGAFERDNKLTKIIIGDNVIKIGKEAFSKCKNLRNVKIGKNVTQIGNKAFYMCTKLTKITISEKVNRIGKQAFYGCRKLKTVTIKSSKLTNSKVGAKAFKYIHAKATFDVPNEKVKVYKNFLRKKGIDSKVKIK